MDKIVFNDYDVTVEIYDSVIAKWVNTDYDETDPKSATYLRNRDKIQPKLVEGTNVTIDPETNEISVEFFGLLRNYGSVATREDLPDTAKVFDAYYITDESLYVFAHFDSALGLVWLPLSFYVDMKLYVSKEELTKILEGYPTNDNMSSAIDEHNTSEESHPFLTSAIESIRKQMLDKEHFRGYYATNAEVLAIPKPERGDYAYSAESGTKWIYDTEWTDSEVIVPDQVVPPSDALPLMDGATPSAGVSNQYSRGDHVHPSDKTKLDKVTSVADGTVVAYVANGKEQGVVGVSDSTAEAGTIACRTESGTLIVNEPTNDNETVPLGFLTKAIDAVSGVRVLGADFATIESGLVEVVVAKAIGNSQMLIQFIPTEDITPAGSPVTVFSGLAESLLPSLGVRFGLVWDEAEVEQVGFCVINSDGDITVNAVATLFKGTQYTLLL